MITGIGDNCIDRYLSPIEAEFVGGNVANVAANIALHGGRAAYVGSVGSDNEGIRIARVLAEVGVDLRWLQCVPGGVTGLTELALSRGDVQILSERYGISSTVELTDQTLDQIASESSWVHTSQTGQAARYVEALQARGVPLSIDIGAVRSTQALHPIAGLAGKFDVVFFSAGSQLTAGAVEALARMIKSHGAEAAVGTRGSAGCLAVDGSGLFAQPAESDSRPVLDPLGAGDAFIAGFLAAAGSPIDARLRQGSRWAADACRIYGCWPQDVTIRTVSRTPAEREA